MHICTYIEATFQLKQDLTSVLPVKNSTTVFYLFIPGTPLSRKSGGGIRPLNTEL